jgi:hypothetical protein
MITKFHLFERSKNSLFESKNDIRTFYHATKPEYLPSIVKHGLTPNIDRKTNWGGKLGKWSKGKVFVTADIFTAQFYRTLYQKIIHKTFFSFEYKFYICNLNQITLTS